LTAPRKARRSCSLESISLKLFSVALLQQGTEVRQVLDPVFKEPAPVSGLILWGAESLLSSLVARLAPRTRERYDTEGISSCQPLLRRKSGGFLASRSCHRRWLVTVSIGAVELASAQANLLASALALVTA